MKAVHVAEIRGYIYLNCNLRRCATCVRHADRYAYRTASLLFPIIHFQLLKCFPRLTPSIWSSCRDCGAKTDNRRVMRIILIIVVIVGCYTWGLRKKNYQVHRYHPTAFRSTVSSVARPPQLHKTHLRSSGVQSSPPKAP